MTPSGLVEFRTLNKKPATQPVEPNSLKDAETFQKKSSNSTKSWNDTYQGTVRASGYIPYWMLTIAAYWQDDFEEAQENERAVQRYRHGGAGGLLEKSGSYEFLNNGTANSHLENVEGQHQMLFASPAC